MADKFVYRPVWVEMRSFIEITSFSDQDKMIYNDQTNLFELSLPFKQGFYNYLYVVADERGKVDKKAIEGSYYQTENEYEVVVYFKQFGDRYTQVIGIGAGNSEILRN